MQKKAFIGQGTAASCGMALVDSGMRREKGSEIDLQAIPGMPFALNHLAALQDEESFIGQGTSAEITISRPKPKRIK